MPKRTPPGQTLKITRAAWYREVVGDPDSPPPARLAGRQEKLLDAMDNGGPDAVRPIVESWGLVWTVGPRGGIRVDVPDPSPES
ncbi:hypothetical protein [Streptomyces sp. NPDC020141]|uniref:hypothetical protein n=1 Tax=Streptomyces sp. NPDC020141 TaxID=3365065 RepID=UPI003798BD11